MPIKNSKRKKDIQKKEIKIKNVIKYKKLKNKYILTKKNKELKILKKCNKKLLKSKNDKRNLYLEIDKINNNGKKTIVYFVDNYYPNVDGVLMVMENYAKFMKQYYNIVVCAPKHKNYQHQNKNYLVLFADSIYLKKQGYDLAFPQLDNKFQKILSLLKIDLIHIHAPFNMGTFGLNLAKKRNIPCFATFHSQYKRDFYQATKNKTLSNILTKLILYVYQNATLCLTMNDFSRNLMFEYGLKNNVEIVSNATNMKKKEFEPKFEKEVLNKYKINVKTNNILFIGRLVAVKNIYFILDVLKELYKVNKDFNFIFMGDGPEYKKLQEKIIEYNLQNNIILTGKVFDEDEKAIIIKNSKLLFFPSEYDTDGIVKMECACYEVPTLCLKDTGASSSIIDNQNGFIVGKSEKECAEKLEFLLKNVKILKNIGKKSKIEVYKNWNDVCYELKNKYEIYFNKSYKKRK